MMSAPPRPGYGTRLSNGLLDRLGSVAHVFRHFGQLVIEGGDLGVQPDDVLGAVLDDGSLALLHQLLDLQLESQGTIRILRK
jgi:transcriptional/translational regulatory protein YebC/TACO1